MALMEEAMELHQRTEAGMLKAIGRDCSALTTMAAKTIAKKTLRIKTLQLGIAAADDERANADIRKADTNRKKLESELERQQAAIVVAERTQALAALPPLPVPRGWSKVVQTLYRFGICW